MHNTYFTLIFFIFMQCKYLNKISKNIIKIMNSDFLRWKKLQTMFLLKICKDETAFVQWKIVLSKISQPPLIVSSTGLATEV